jgi:hypothetical protein
MAPYTEPWWIKIVNNYNQCTNVEIKQTVKTNKLIKAPGTGFCSIRGLQTSLLPGEGAHCGHGDHGRDQLKRKKIKDQFKIFLKEPPCSKLVLLKKFYKTFESNINEKRLY